MNLLCLFGHSYKKPKKKGNLWYKGTYPKCQRCCLHISEWQKVKWKLKCYFFGHALDYTGEDELLMVMCKRCFSGDIYWDGLFRMWKHSWVKFTCKIKGHVGNSEDETCNRCGEKIEE